MDTRFSQFNSSACGLTVHALYTEAVYHQPTTNSILRLHAEAVHNVCHADDNGGAHQAQAYVVCAIPRGTSSEHQPVISELHAGALVKDFTLTRWAEW